MDKLILNNTGGLLAVQEVYKYMQQCYAGAVGYITGMYGNNVILSGCDVVGGDISSGVVIINGELLPFIGGELKTGISLHISSANESYRHLAPQSFYLTRAAIPDDLGTPLASFVRLKKIADHYSDNANPHAVTKLQAGLGNLPNSISDSIELNDGNSLATSKAIFEAAKFPHIITGNLYIGNIGVPEDNHHTIVHNAGTADYTAILTASSTNLTNFQEWYACMRVTEKRANEMDIHLWEGYTYSAQQITVHYLLLKTL